MCAEVLCAVVTPRRAHASIEGEFAPGGVDDGGGGGGGRRGGKKHDVNAVKRFCVDFVFGGRGDDSMRLDGGPIKRRRDGRDEEKRTETKKKLSQYGVREA